MEKLECPFLEECREDKYNSCYTDSHRLCMDYEDFLQRQIYITPTIKRAERKDLNTKFS